MNLLTMRFSLVFGFLKNIKKIKNLKSLYMLIKKKKKKKENSVSCWFMPVVQLTGLVKYTWFIWYFICKLNWMHAYVILSEF